jgi:EAL domain-containing protein (putative c-di-GMP-specific phosphodiesterase class I)
MLVNYQPIVDIETRKVVKAEALCRFPESPPGLDNPDDFIKYAERHGIIKGLTEWLLSTTLDFWQKLGPLAPDALAINLSVQNLLEVDLADRVLAALDQFKMDPSRFFLEIDERMLDLHDNTAHANINKLKAKGVGLAIDDFGPSLSPVSHLEISALGISELKLDRAMLVNLDDNAKNRASMKTIQEIAYDGSIDLAAKAIESEATVEWLTRFGFSRMQGYLIAPPMDPEAFTAWLRANPK